MRKDDKIGRITVLLFTVFFFGIAVYSYFSINSTEDIKSYKELLYASSFSIIFLFCWYLEVKPIEEKKKKEKEEQKKKFRDTYRYLMHKEIEKIKQKDDE